MTLLLLRILHLASSLLPRPYDRWRRMSGSLQLAGCYHKWSLWFLLVSSILFIVIISWGRCCCFLALFSFFDLPPFFLNYSHIKFSSLDHLWSLNFMLIRCHHFTRPHPSKPISLYWWENSAQKFFFAVCSLLFSLLFNGGLKLIHCWSACT